MNLHSSLYIHVPFCKKACHYCSFYFVVSPAQIENYLNAVLREIESRKIETIGQVIDTIYFGGGTPSLLAIADIERILKSIYANYHIAKDVEISMESNPENLSTEYIQDLKKLGINRLSIGVQSFFDEDLSTMNRAHTSTDAKSAIQNAKMAFDNLSIDFIFGLPYSGMENWKKNLSIAIEFDIPHISTYNLTVEEKTYLARKVARKELPIEPDNTLNEMYLYTLDFLGAAGYTNYEISNFGKVPYYSRHNIAYWSGVPYLGFGPSAHSYDGESRRWNIANLKNYIEKLGKNEIYWDSELLTPENQYNEFIMTRLRRDTGIPLEELESKFGPIALNKFTEAIPTFIEQNQLIRIDNSYRLTNRGKLIADYISGELMI